MRVRVRVRVRVRYLAGPGCAHEPSSPIDSHAKVICAAGGGVGTDFRHLPLIDAHLRSKALEEQLTIIPKRGAGLRQRFQTLIPVTPAIGWQRLLGQNGLLESRCDVAGHISPDSLLEYPANL